MKPLLLGVPCIRTSLSLPAFAQGTPSHRQNDLTSEPGRSTPNTSVPRPSIKKSTGITRGKANRSALWVLNHVEHIRATD